MKKPVEYETWTVEMDGLRVTDADFTWSQHMLPVGGGGHDDLRAAMADAEQRLADAREHLNNAPLISRSRDCALAEIRAVHEEILVLRKLVKARKRVDSV